MGSMIEVRGLTKQFKGFTAVNDLSFTVNEGDVYGFLGQNGAGKSTTLRMMLKLIEPTSGEIVFSGKNIANDNNNMLRQTGAIIERPDMYKYLSAYDNLYIFAKMSGIKVSKKLLMDQLAMVGLDERHKDIVKTFSQGMKQRLGIAIALVHQPKLIILDEPTNGLDPQGIADMRNLILRLSREMGKTVIVSSHLLSEIEIIANRMIIIHKGQKIVEGKVTELLDPANTLVEITSVDSAATLAALQQTNWAAQVETHTNKMLRLRMNRSDVPQLVQQLTHLQSQILSVQPRHSLEDYFLSLTNNDTHVEPFTN
ncbi:ABC transporter ATP-binding protein [Ferruginibacter yonginensis]|uniref:ABC transporter ATP-binding protein n=1 Tax=Ferruginibacter yonginensis TaxID=1310416 RepID=A0ABV8QQT9_9BACT